jgi:hypothetical protein
MTTSDDQLAEDLWKEIGYPTPESKFWERLTLLASSDGTDRLQSPVLAVGLERRNSLSSLHTASLPKPGQLSSAPVRWCVERTVRVSPWPRPLPRQRITPLSVLGQFRDKATSDRVMHGDALSLAGSPVFLPVVDARIHEEEIGIQNPMPPSDCMVIETFHLSGFIWVTGLRLCGLVYSMLGFHLPRAMLPPSASYFLHTRVQTKTTPSTEIFPRPVVLHPHLRCDEAIKRR